MWRVAALRRNVKDARVDSLDVCVGISSYEKREQAGLDEVATNIGGRDGYGKNFGAIRFFDVRSAPEIVDDFGLTYPLFVDASKDEDHNSVFARCTNPDFEEFLIIAFNHYFSARTQAP